MQKRYFIKLSYLGTHYHGWQIQPNAMTVQQKINEALEVLLRAPQMITGCGRTDAGVHANQFFAHLEIDFDKVRFPFEQMRYKLNSILPFDIAIQDIFEVDKEAHTRFDASSRTYEYHIVTQKNPFKKDLSYQLPIRYVDFEKMNKAAETLFEYTDFECFSKTGTDVNTFNCKIMKAAWKLEEDHLWVFTIQADRFLRNMVRAIVGTLLEVGQGKMSLQEFREVIESKNRGNAGWSVPGQALFLTRVAYPFLNN